MKQRTHCAMCGHTRPYPDYVLEMRVVNKSWPLMMPGVDWPDKLPTNVRVSICSECVKGLIPTFQSVEQVPQ